MATPSLPPSDTGTLPSLAARPLAEGYPFRPAGMPSPEHIHASVIDQVHSFSGVPEVSSAHRPGLVLRTKTFGVYDQNRCADRFQGDMQRWIVTDLYKGERIKSLDKWPSALNAVGLDPKLYENPDRLHQAAGSVAYTQWKRRSNIRPWSNLPGRSKIRPACPVFLYRTSA